MRYYREIRTAFVSSILMLIATTCLAGNVLFKEARTLQRNGHFDQAISAYKDYLSNYNTDDKLEGKHLIEYTEALVQIMNTFQSKGEPEECISVLKEIYNVSPALQNECHRDFCSVMGYALSRTEKMKEAEATMLKALTLPIHEPTPERYFRDYAYAAAVFYSNPDYLDEVIKWCEEALTQARLCNNTSGSQWVMTMLGSLYKREGKLSKALELYQKSHEESESRGDNQGLLNSLNSLIDLFLYFDIPEYADRHANEAISIKSKTDGVNPMVAAQIYINKGRALNRLGVKDSILFYTGKAGEFCGTLPYNSGMVDIDLLNGLYFTEVGGDSLNMGIEHLQNVVKNGTGANRARAYHQLAQTYLKNGQNNKAEIMLDSLYFIVNHNDSPIHILHIDYKPILDYYQKKGNRQKVSQYVEMSLHEQKMFKESSFNYNLVEAIVDLQTGSRLKELKILKLKQANQRLWIMICIAMYLITIGAVVVILLHQRKKHKMKESNVGKDQITKQVKEFLNEKENRQEFETFSPYVLKESGEVKFRQCFELLNPHFLPRLREKVPSVSRREELLSMLIALRQDNKQIAELLDIEPRSVLMLRHRFRQKIGMNTGYSLENFIETLLY